MTKFMHYEVWKGYSVWHGRLVLPLPPPCSKHVIAISCWGESQLPSVVTLE